MWTQQPQFPFNFPEAFRALMAAPPQPHPLPEAEIPPIPPPQAPPQDYLRKSSVNAESESGQGSEQKKKGKRSRARKSDPPNASALNPALILNMEHHLFPTPATANVRLSMLAKPIVPDSAELLAVKTPMTTVQDDVILTLKLDHIPKKVTRDMLVTKTQDVGFRQDLEFVYMPIDLRSKRGVGHALLSFRSGEACQHFTEKFDGVPSKSMFPTAGSLQKLETSPAPVQGSAANIQKLEQSGLLLSMLADMPGWLPQLFDEHGEVIEGVFTDLD